METCAGCGEPLAPSWKFCVYCGIAVPKREVPAAIRPDNVADASVRRRNRLLILGGVGIFVVGLALLVFAVLIFTANAH